MAILKIGLSALIIYLATELGKRSGKMGGLILSLPLTSIIAIGWIWYESKDASKVASMTSETLIFILPSFAFFLVLPLMLNRAINFYFSFGIALLVTLIAYAVFFKIRN